MSRRDRIERNRHADLSAGAVDAMRRWADEGLGFNCTFVDDDMKVIVGLAQRAVLAGLASDFSPDMQKRFTEAAEREREAHEKSLGRLLVGVQRPEDVAREQAQELAQRIHDIWYRVYGIQCLTSDAIKAATEIILLALPHTGQPQEGVPDCWAPWRALADAPVVPTKTHLKSTKLFLGSRYGSVGDAREIFQGDGFANQCVAVAINGDVAERLVRAANAAPASPQRAEGEQIKWLRVNGEPFEYAIQQGPHGDDFVKLIDGSCLRRHLILADQRPEER